MCRSQFEVIIDTGFTVSIVPKHYLHNIDDARKVVTTDMIEDERYVEQISSLVFFPNIWKLQCFAVYLSTQLAHMRNAYQAKCKKLIHYLRYLVVRLPF